MKLTGSEIIVDCLVREGVPYALGIPGHGCLALADAFLKRRSEIEVLLPRHEQAAVHLADAYCRVSGKPLAVFTSIGPGACNTVIGAATCFVDSIPVLIMTGDTHVHMRGKGVLQEIERKRFSDFPRILEPVTKRSFQVSAASQLPFVMQRAFSAMLTGRRGPVHIDLPMDVQAAAVEASPAEPVSRRARAEAFGDPRAIQQAAELLLSAERPVILAGGGALYSGAAPVLQDLAEHVGAAVVTTLAGKGVFPENHRLSGLLTGSKGTTVGVELATGADVMLAVGCRFADETTSSYRPGHALSIPPTRLIHLDIDPEEIGKNYPVEIGIVGDARAGLSELLTAARNARSEPAATDAAYGEKIARLRAQWLETIREQRESDAVPMTISRLLKEAQELLPEETLIVHSSGNTQAQILQEWFFSVPGTSVTTAGFSTMGWTLPAALGAKLAAPDRPVVGVVGDGDFLMTIQELATAAQYGIPVVVLVANNIGWIAIKDLQCAVYGEDHTVAVDFARRDGDLVTPDLAAAARAFGCHGERIEAPDEVKPALQRALDSGGPAVVECLVARDFPQSGGAAFGWWDVPVPTYLEEGRARYERESAEERLG